MDGKDVAVPNAFRQLSARLSVQNRLKCRALKDRMPAAEYHSQP
jgi:hypothetical protein